MEDKHVEEGIGEKCSGKCLLSLTGRTWGYKRLWPTRSSLCGSRPFFSRPHWTRKFTKVCEKERGHRCVCERNEKFGKWLFFFNIGWGANSDVRESEMQPSKKSFGSEQGNFHPFFVFSCFETTCSSRLVRFRWFGAHFFFLGISSAGDFVSFFRPQFITQNLILDSCSDSTGVCPTSDGVDVAVKNAANGLE